MSFDEREARRWLLHPVDYLLILTMNKDG